jgi:hypothetical protein
MQAVWRSFEKNSLGAPKSGLNRLYGKQMAKTGTA